jgi:hypothetical protein
MSSHPLVRCSGHALCAFDVLLAADMRSSELLGEQEQMLVRPMDEESIRLPDTAAAKPRWCRWQRHALVLSRCC